jgi:putative transposase
MARLERLVVAGEAHLVSLQSLDTEPTFRDADDAQKLLSVIAGAVVAHCVAVHGFVLLPSGVLLLATPDHKDGLSTAIQSIGRLYVAAFNRRHGRSGTLWKGRFQAAPVEGTRHILSCLLFLEQAPLRMNLASRAVHYPWSSAAHHVGVDRLAWIRDHPQTWSLGNTPFEREAAYARLLESPLVPEEVQLIESRALKGWVLGSSGFAQSLSAEGRRTLPLKRGRRPKAYGDRPN